MPRMPKKAPVVTAGSEDEKLAALARALPEPADFYAGRRHSGRQLPDDILLFHRTREAKLNQATGAKAFHQRYVLIVPLRGDGRVIANARTFSLVPGGCMLIAPFQFHHYTAIATPEIDWLFITFTYGNLPPAGLATGIFSIEASFRSDLAELVREFRETGGANRGDRLAWRLALMLDRLSAGAAAEPAEPVAPVVREELMLRVSAISAAHLQNPLPVRQLAKELGLSPSHLRQRFQKTAGISLGRFLREFRLRHAAELLATGRANVTEASVACGWETPYSFSRAFRKYWGRPPKSFATGQRGAK